MGMAVQGAVNGPIPQAFKDNADFVNAHNSKQSTYELTYTGPLAAKTREEYKQLLGYTTSSSYGDLPSAGQHVNSGVAAPESIDWTTKGAVTPVKNQGQCGSCWAFSTTGSAEGALAIAAGLGANSLVSLSEQELVDCAGSFGNQGCNGGLMDDGFKFLEADGDSTESDYAYTGVSGTCSSSKESAAAGLKKGKITSYSDVTPKSCTQMMAAVAKGPVSVAIEADQTGFQHYSTGVFSGTCGTSLDHGVLVVGY